MAGLLNAATSMMCPHGGQVTAITSNTRAKADGAFLLRASDTFTIAGCPFVVGVVLLHPCVKVTWAQPALQSKTMSDPNLTEASVGLCMAADQAVQGTVQILSTQQKVAGL
jgi:hypothetical protein